MWEAVFEARKLRGNFTEAMVRFNVPIVIGHFGKTVTGQMI